MAVCVLEDFNILKLAKKILKSASGEISENMSMDEVEKNCQTVYFWEKIRRVACIQSYLVRWTLFESQVWQTRLWTGKRTL